MNGKIRTPKLFTAKARGCLSLASIVVPEGVTISEGFYGCGGEYGGENNDHSE
jgi:hypothetical protein